MERLWWLNEESEQILNRGYLLKGETAQTAIKRIATAAAQRLYKPELIAELAAENVRLKTKFDAEEAEKKANAESKGEIYIVKQYSEIKYFDFKVVTNVFYNKYHQFTHERDAVVHLRNKFAHNEFPEKSVLTQLDVFQKIVDDYPNSIDMRKRSIRFSSSGISGVLSILACFSLAYSMLLG